MMDEAVYRKVATCLEPDDIEEAVANSDFRAAVGLAYMLGREAAFAEAAVTMRDIENHLTQVEVALQRVVDARSGAGAQ